MRFTSEYFYWETKTVDEIGFHQCKKECDPGLKLFSQRNTIIGKHGFQSVSRVFPKSDSQDSPYSQKLPE